MRNTLCRVAIVAIGLSLLATGCGPKEEAKGGEGGAQSGSGAKDTGKKLKIGFSQIGAESDWRKANTASIKEEAEKRGIDLKFSDAQQKQENQIKALKSFITQKVDVIMFSPVVEDGWAPVMKEIKAAKIPVIVSDRRPNVPDDLYETFIGSDFIDEGKRAAEWVVKKTGGKGTIAEIEGTVGSAPANDRKKGFDDVIKTSGMKIIVSQSGDFKRKNGKEVMEAILKNPAWKDVNVVFAHNDDMALGAIQAIEDAGKKPGVDIIIVSIDGVKAALEAIKAGKLNCSVECNPLIGADLFDAAKKVLAGEKLPKRTIVKDGLFDSTNVEKELPTRKY